MKILNINFPNFQLLRVAAGSKILFVKFSKLNLVSKTTYFHGFCSSGNAAKLTIEKTILKSKIFLIFCSNFQTEFSEIVAPNQLQLQFVRQFEKRLIILHVIGNSNRMSIFWWEMFFNDSIIITFTWRINQFLLLNTFFFFFRRQFLCQLDFFLLRLQSSGSFRLVSTILIISCPFSWYCECWLPCVYTMKDIDNVYRTAQKMKFSIKDLFNKCDQICCGFGQIYWRNP